MTLKFKLPTLLFSTVLISTSSFAQVTPMPKKAPTAEGHSEHDGHNHATPPELDPKDVPFTFDEAPDDHVLGDAAAPTTLIVYASVTCQHCSDWFTNEWPEIKNSLIKTKKVRFVLRELPTAPQELSMVGFMMAECASAEDYFKVIEYQMENRAKIFEGAVAGKAREEYDKVGKIAGLNNESAIQACFADPEKLEHIRTSSRRATAAKVAGVPAFYINGEVYKGEQDAKSLIKFINNVDKAGISKLP